jgi:hypothetical protein
VVDRGIAPDYDQPVAGVITRAVEPIADTLARVAGCLVQDGMVIFMKGPRCDEEIERASKAFAATMNWPRTSPTRSPTPRTGAGWWSIGEKVNPIPAKGQTLK